jgi:hypothetical protein
MGWLQAGQSLFRLSKPLLCSQLICWSTPKPITAARASTLSIVDLKRAGNAVFVSVPPGRSLAVSEPLLFLHN